MAGSNETAVVPPGWDLSGSLYAPVWGTALLVVLVFVAVWQWRRFRSKYRKTKREHQERQGDVELLREMLQKQQSQSQIGLGDSTNGGPPSAAAAHHHAHHHATSQDSRTLSPLLDPQKADHLTMLIRNSSVLPLPAGHSPDNASPPSTLGRVPGGGGSSGISLPKLIKKKLSFNNTSNLEHSAVPEPPQLPEQPNRRSTGSPTPPHSRIPTSGSGFNLLVGSSGSAYNPDVPSASNRDTASVGNVSLSARPPFLKNPSCSSILDGGGGILDAAAASRSHSHNTLHAISTPCSPAQQFQNRASVPNTEHSYHPASGGFSPSLPPPATAAASSIPPRKRGPSVKNGAMSVQIPDTPVVCHTPHPALCSPQAASRMSLSQCSTGWNPERRSSALADPPHSLSQSRQSSSQGLGAVLPGIPKQWQRGQLLGSGSYGNVYMGVRQNGTFFAAKVIPLNDALPRERLVELKREVELMSNLQHKNIVSYFGCSIEKEELIVFMEYVQGGSLGSLVRKHGQRLTERAVAAYTLQILEGVEYLHRNNIIHRDLKGDNILWGEAGAVKLADFGTSKRMNETCITHLAGTPLWMAPEAITSQKSITLKADIWSLGCVVCELLNCGKPPWPSEWESSWQALYAIGNWTEELPPEIPDSLSEVAISFLKACFRIDPLARSCAGELQGHDFIRLTEVEDEDDDEDEKQVVYDQDDEIAYAEETGEDHVEGSEDLRRVQSSHFGGFRDGFTFGHPEHPPATATSSQGGGGGVTSPKVSYMKLSVNAPGNSPATPGGLGAGLTRRHSSYRSMPGSVDMGRSVSEVLDGMIEASSPKGAGGGGPDCGSPGLSPSFAKKRQSSAYVHRNAPEPAWIRTASDFGDDDEDETEDDGTESAAEYDKTTPLSGGNCSNTLAYDTPLPRQPTSPALLRACNSNDAVAAKLRSAYSETAAAAAAVSAVTSADSNPVSPGAAGGARRSPRASPLLNGLRKHSSGSSQQQAPLSPLSPAGTVQTPQTSQGATKSLKSSSPTPSLASGRNLSVHGAAASGLRVTPPHSPDVRASPLQSFAPLPRDPLGSSVSGEKVPSLLSPPARPATQQHTQSYFQPAVAEL
eukprot:Rhum_TRINITY_DN14828_c9_g1::Rhum_TRINITY_DN14828_c9_g1_i1::g.123941::m.123941